MRSTDIAQQMSGTGVVVDRIPDFVISGMDSAIHIDRLSLPCGENHVYVVARVLMNPSLLTRREI